MKNAIRISVKETCSEKFENFKKTALGGFCDSCHTEVVDFTAMTDEQIVEHFDTRSGKTCGRFKKSQLKTYKTNPFTAMNTNVLTRSLGLMGFSLLALCATPTLVAQESVELNSLQTETPLETHKKVVASNIEKTYTVKGTVVDEDNLPMPGASVVLKGTSEGTTTDIDGRFEFPRSLEEGDVLVFNYLGYDTKEYRIPNSASDVIDITIMFEYADVELMGEVVVGGVYASKRNIFQRFFDLFR